MKQQLSSDFINELLKICMRNGATLNVAYQHIKFTYLPNEDYKHIWKAMTDYYVGSSSLITYGLLIEKFKDNPDVIAVIGNIRNADNADPEALIKQLETFVKQNIFIEAYGRLADEFNKGNKEEAYSLMSSISEEITGFTIREKTHTKIFEGFAERNVLRKKEHEDEKSIIKSKIPTGIDQLDDILRGGVDRGDTFLALAQSGVGKSKFLKHCGVHAARAGFKVLHIQAEGSRKEALDAYDSAWTGQKLSIIEVGAISESVKKDTERAVKNLKFNGGEIYVHCFEQFGTANLGQVRDLLLDFEKEGIHIDLLLMDYLELFDPGNTKRYATSNEGERKRREDVANEMKDIAVKLNLVAMSATQASTVDPKDLDDPKFVQTRYNVSEFKGIVKPFSYFMTMNQSKDEKKSSFMRLYMDKIRKYQGQQTIPIFTKYNIERFYDRKKSIDELYDM